MHHLQKGRKTHEGHVYSGIYGIFRVGELAYTKNRNTVITWEEVKDNKDYIILKVHAAKTSKEGEPQEVELVLTHDKTCPVLHLKHYLAASSARKGPLFQFPSGDRITRNFFRDKLRTLLQFLGVSGRRVTGHSFRAGGESFLLKPRVF